MKIIKIVLISLIILNLVQYNLYIYAWHNFFYQCESVQYLLYSSVLYFVFKDKGFWLPVLCVTLMIFAINDLVDLFFCDPTKFGWNEVISCLIALIITVRKLKWITHKKQRLR